MPVLNIESIDDGLLFDGTTDFSGGQSSYARSTAIGPSQSVLMTNCQLGLVGELRKRRGTANVAQEGLNVTSGGDPVQALIYYNTVIEEKLVAFAGGHAYYLDTFANTWESFFTASITDHNEMVNLVQLTDDLFWTDSNQTGIRHYNGTTVATVAGSPVATILTSFTNRLIASGYSSVPDAVYFSDLLDGTTWNMSTQSLRIGGGDGDNIVAIKGWQDSLLLVLKRDSTYLIDISPQLTIANFTVKCIHQSIGCVASQSVAQVGQDIFYLSRSGVQSVQKQLATSNNEVTIPVSLPIQDVIDKINWPYVHKSTAAFYNNQYMLSVPIDSDTPDTILVFNATTKGWSIFRDMPAICMTEQPFAGRSRLVCGTNSGRVFGWLDYLDESEEPENAYSDGEGALQFPIQLDAQFPPAPSVYLKAITRSYIFNEPINFKNGWYLEIEFKERAGSAEIFAIFDGKTEDPIKLHEVHFDPVGALLPFLLPTLLPQPGWQVVILPLYGKPLPIFREIQIEIRSATGNCIIRSISLSSFIETMHFNKSGYYR